MLNLQDFCCLLMIPVGAISGIVNAHDMKAGTLAIILFGFIGLLLGFGAAFGTAALCKRHVPSIVYRLMPIFGIFAAGAAPSLLVLIIYGHK
ncbi:MAG: hypothetical protein ACLQU4_20775 [Limisphaerales bacterium]